MPTTFGMADVLPGGRFTFNQSVGGITAALKVGANSEWRAVVTGTDATAGIYADGSTYKWTVDGGSQQTASPTGNTAQQLSVFSGLTDGPHTVVLKIGNYFDQNSTVVVTGSSPAVAIPAGFGATSTRVADGSGVTNDNSQPATLNAEGYDKLQPRGSDRFVAQCSQVNVWCRTDASGGLGDIALCVDGNPYVNYQFITPSVGSGNWGWISFTGLDNTAFHTYRLVIDNSAYVYAVNTNGTFSTAALTPFPAIFHFGDSIVAATNCPTHGDASNYPALMGLIGDYGWQILAAPGATAFTYGQANDAAPGAANPSCPIVYIDFGFNDQAGGATSIPNWTTAITNIVTKIHSDLPNALIVWTAILPVPNAATNGPTYNAALQSALAAFGTSLIQYLPNSQLVATTCDGTHPNNTMCLNQIAPWYLSPLAARPQIVLGAN